MQRPHPEGLAAEMLTPASLKTQRHQDRMKEGSAPLCVFASLREPIRVLRALRGPKNLTSLNHESHSAHESFHRRCHQREPWQPQETREVVKAAKSWRDGALPSLDVYQWPLRVSPRRSGTGCEFPS